jgi:Cys-tRNA synthase (O-phospho-L-seryl-tRNA:Cys-tRNA synthase)
MGRNKCKGTGNVGSVAEVCGSGSKDMVEKPPMNYFLKDVCESCGGMIVVVFMYDYNGSGYKKELMVSHAYCERCLKITVLPNDPFSAFKQHLKGF